jgi:hypothetical protein
VKNTLRLKTGITGLILGFLIMFQASTFFYMVFGTLYIALMFYTIGKIWESTEKLYKRLIIIFGILVLFVGLFIVLGMISGAFMSCMAYMPYTAQNPVTGVCESYVYGGCGPKPHPWYYKESCNPKSLQEMCQKTGPNNEESRICRQVPVSLTRIDDLDLSCDRLADRINAPAQKYQCSINSRFINKHKSEDLRRGFPEGSKYAVYQNNEKIVDSGNLNLLPRIIDGFRHEIPIEKLDEGNLQLCLDTNKTPNPGKDSSYCSKLDINISRVDFNLSKDKVQFESNKSSSITITNTGEVPIPLYIEMPEINASFDKKVDVPYRVKGKVKTINEMEPYRKSGIGSENLEPGRSLKVSFKPLIFVESSNNQTSLIYPPNKYNITVYATENIKKTVTFIAKP